MLCAPSIITGTPWLWAMRMISLTGLTVPRTLLTCMTLTSFVFSLNNFSYSSRSSVPSSLMGMTRRRMFLRCCCSCQGTMLEWCSIVLTMTSSPSSMQPSTKDEATRFRLSVVPRVKTISLVERALTNFLTVSRAASWRSVACCESQWTPRWTLALTFKYSSRMASSTQSGFWVVAPLSR